MAGLIAAGTPVRSDNDSEWMPLEQSRAPIPDAPAPATERASTEDPGYWYLNDAGQPIGPVSSGALRLLWQSSRLTADTLVARRGDSTWNRLQSLPGFLPPGSVPPAVPLEAPETPKHRRFADFALPMGLTLTLYSFYIVPSYSRDMRLITRKPRMEFMPLLVLGITTLGLALSVFLTIWAFDLERHGRELQKPERRKWLGEHVLVLTLVGLLTFFWNDEAPAILVGIGTMFWSVWLIQSEINLYAQPDDAA